MPPNNILSDDQKRNFIRDGFLILPSLVPPTMIAAALTVADEAYSSNDYHINTDGPDPVPRFRGRHQRHPDVGDVMARSDILPACVDLLGEGNVKCPHLAQIAFRPRDSRWVNSKLGIEDLMQDHRYHIDGGEGVFAKTGSPFSLLVGVCLSPGQDVDENRGQFTAWPGSHYKLHEVVRSRWQQGLIDGHGIFGGRKQKPDIGSPQRVLLNPGDVIIAHQRLGHAGGVNLCDDIRKNLYFRVHHRNHERLLETYLTGSVFTEFGGLRDLLPEGEVADEIEGGGDDDVADEDDS